MRRFNRAFTLVELVVVLAIIATLSAIVFPVTARARKSARRTEAISNLRQCGLALEIYTGDWDVLPPASAVDAVLEKAPTCDRDDHWRRTCEQPSDSPRVGSFGYVRKLSDYQEEPSWMRATTSESPPALLADIFQSEIPIAPFPGESPSDYVGCFKRGECLMPSPVLQILTDTSLKRRTRFSTREIVSGRTYRLFTWPSAFETHD